VPRRERPIARFDLRPSAPHAGQSVELVDDSHDPGGVGIAWRAWDFGDGTTATGSAPTHRFPAAGAYVVRLTLATFDGRLAFSEIDVRVASRSRGIGVPKPRC
jgi:PKD repeat protein